MMLCAASVERQFPVALVVVPSGFSQRGDGGTGTVVSPVARVWRRAVGTDLRHARQWSLLVGASHLLLLQSEQESHSHQGQLMPSYYYASAANIQWQRHYVSWWSVRCPSVRRSSVNTYFAWRAGISVKLVTNIHHVSGYCSTSFQGQRSRSCVYKCMNATTAKAYISTVWSGGLGPTCFCFAAGTSPRIEASGAPLLFLPFLIHFLLKHFPTTALWHCRLGYLTRETRPRYDLYCVWWDVKPYSTINPPPPPTNVAKRPTNDGQNPIN